MRGIGGFLITLFLFFTSSWAQCPHSDVSLALWSATPAWSVSGANVVIPAGTRVKLNVGNLPKLTSITVSGELVFDNIDINLDVDWIKVNSGGKLIAGSETCQITSKIIITLYGERSKTASPIGSDPFDGTVLGSKGIAILTGATVELHGRVQGPSWVRLAATAQAGSSTLVLESPVQWRAGDQIVIASTDFGAVYNNINSTFASLSWMRGNPPFPEQSENRTIASVNGNTITLTQPLSYMHYGAGYERAEVGLLSRQIVIRGDNSSVQSEFGGHFIMRKANAIHLEGVEFTRMGQKGLLGRYPVHFHLLREVFDAGFWAKDLSIHHNFQRCLVVHESHGLLIQNNVAYDTFGHCYFLEDGAERGNTFDRNLGVYAKPVAREDPLQIIPTDSDVSIFWITFPNNTFTNNAAVGGKFSYWFVLPPYAIGLAASFYPPDDPWIRPRQTPLGEFRGNVAHGAVDTCLEIDTFLNPDGTADETQGSYNPRRGPFYPNVTSYAYVEPVFRDFTAYKCRQFGTWGESSMRFIGYKSINNRRGIMVNGVTLVEDSIFIGESDNIGTPFISRGHTRSYPDNNGGNTTLIQGHESYDNGGPQISKNNIFINFTSTATRKAGGLGNLLNGPFMLDTENRMINLTFINANRIYIPPNAQDNQWGVAMLDLDGTTTDLPFGGWVVSNSSHMLDDDCIPRPEWNGYACPPFGEGYIQVTIVNERGKPDNTGSNGIDYTPPAGQRVVRSVFTKIGQPQRNGTSNGASVDCGIGTRACYQYMNNLRARTGWVVKFVINEFPQKTPGNMTVNMHSSAPGDWVVLAFPYPPSAQPFSLQFRRYSTDPAPIEMQQACSLADLNYTTYYYDTTTEHLYIMMFNTNEPTAISDLATRWGIVDYSSTDPRVRILASCLDNCIPTKLDVPSPAKYVNEERYKATLQTTGGATEGTAFFFYDLKTNKLHYHIIHSRTYTASSIQFLDAANNPITTKFFPTALSPARGLMVLSKSQWDAFSKGQWKLRVNTNEGPLTGTITCQETSCTPPESVSTVAQCDAPANVTHLKIFTDSLQSNFRDGSYNGSSNPPYSSKDFNNTEDFYCGTSSIKFVMTNGGTVQLLTPSAATSVNVSLDIYKSFEFFVKLASGNDTQLRVFFRNESDQTIATVTVSPRHVENLVVDQTQWTRVRISLTELGFTAPLTKIRRLFIQQVTNEHRVYHFDELRFTSEEAAPAPQYCALPPVDQSNPTEDPIEDSATRFFVSLFAILLVLFH